MLNRTFFIIGKGRTCIEFSWTTVNLKWFFRSIWTTTFLYKLHISLSRSTSEVTKYERHYKSTIRNNDTDGKKEYQILHYSIFTRKQWMLIEISKNTVHYMINKNYQMTGINQSSSSYWYTENYFYQWLINVIVS